MFILFSDHITTKHGHFTWILNWAALGLTLSGPQKMGEHHFGVARSSFFAGSEQLPHSLTLQTADQISIRREAIAPNGCGVVV